jgi:hypothetical protein
VLMRKEIRGISAIEGPFNSLMTIQLRQKDGGSIAQIFFLKSAKTAKYWFFIKELSYH